MNIFKRIIYFLRRPAVIVFDGNSFFKELSSLLFKKEIIFNIEKDIKFAKFLIKYSKSPVVVFFQNNSLLEELDFQEKDIILLRNGFSKRKGVTFGEKENVDFNVSDVNITSQGINFKINYRGSTVPFWASGSFNEKDAEIIAGIAAVAVSRGMNLVEASQKIKDAANFLELKG